MSSRKAATTGWWHGATGTVIDVPLEDAIRTYAAVDLDGPLVHTARSLGISLGDGVPMP